MTSPTELSQEKPVHRWMTLHQPAVFYPYNLDSLDIEQSLSYNARRINSFYLPAVVMFDELRILNPIGFSDQNGLKVK